MGVWRKRMGLIRIYIENMMLYMIVALPFYMMSRVIFIKLKKKPVNVMREIILADTGEFYFSVYMSNEMADIQKNIIGRFRDDLFH